MITMKTVTVFIPSSSCNMRISNRRNSSLSSSRRRRSLGNLHCRRGTKPGKLCLKMGFLTVFYWIEKE
jgi:hypothetical protein